MKRAKPKTQKVPMHHIMSVILPCVMLACKEVFKANQKQIDLLAATIDRYIGYIADGKVTVEELRKMMEVRNED